MNERYFKIGEKQLLNLLIANWRLSCLERDGVDNWEWYMACYQDMIDDFLSQHPDINCEDPKDYYFEDCAQYEIENNFEEIL